MENNFLYRDYIQRLVKMTKDGKIPWAKHSQTTYNYTSMVDVKQFTITIQSAESPILGGRYVFQVVEDSNGVDNALLRIDSQEKSSAMGMFSNTDNEYYSDLDQLFKSIKNKYDSRVIDIFEKLLKE